MIDTAADAGHLDAIEVAVTTERVDVKDLVGQRVSIKRRMQMTNRCVDVNWLDRIAGHQVDAREGLAKPQEILIVHTIPGAARTIQAGHVRSGRHRSERHVVAADLQIVGWVRGMQMKL